MNVIGFKEIAITAMKLPGDWRKVLDDPNVKHQAASIRTFTQLQEPIVRRSDMQLIAGRRRVAAHVYLGLEYVYCKLIECSDDETIAIAKVENAHREHDLGKQKEDLVELVALTTKIEEERRLSPGAAVPRKKAKSVAREIVAESIGLTPGALRQKEYREIQRRKEVQGLRKQDTGIKSLGMEFDDEFKEKIDKVVQGIENAAEKLSRTATVLTQLSNLRVPLHTDRLSYIRTELATLSKALRGLRPSSLCPYCKGIEQIVSACTACLGTGYITQSQEAGVPAELWDEIDSRVVFQGKMLPLDGFLSAEPVTDLTMTVDNDGPEAGVREGDFMNPEEGEESVWG